MEREKKLVAIITAAMIALTIFTPALLVRPVGADESSWYMTVNGVLDSDYYSLYPFLTDASLKLGFSKFGEIIDSTTNVGLEYRDRDAFAPAAGDTVPDMIKKQKWMSGWLINITYATTGGTRNVWAMAQHADLKGFGQDWIRVDKNYSYAGALTEAGEDPSDEGRLISGGTVLYNGGRKTNGTATTDPILVLYNGPRMFVARTVTHIFDWDLDWSEDEPLVDVVFTFIFNKDKKEVIVIKDIKEATTKFVFQDMKVPLVDDHYTEGNWVTTANATVEGAIIQFSNRGEWDIGPDESFDSYVHFYVRNNSEARDTYYDFTNITSDSYHLNPTLPFATWLGISDHGSEPNATGQYDFAQIVSSDLAYVGWAAFWPCLSNWHVAAGTGPWYTSLSANTSITDAPSEPFRSPYLIGEWDFVLTTTAVNKTSGNYWRLFNRQFRGVSVYGLTDNWIGDDKDRTDAEDNVVDREVEYQLDEVFKPWDLVSAVDKKTNRWVEFHTVNATEYAAAVAHEDLYITLSHSPVVYSDYWEKYCNDSEIVEWGGAMKHPVRSVWAASASLFSTAEPYQLVYTSGTGVGQIRIGYGQVPATGTVIKIMYSTWTDYTYTVSKSVTDLHNYGAVEEFTTWTGVNATHGATFNNTWTDLLGADHNITMQYSHALNISAHATNGSLSLGGTLEFDATDVKVFKEDGTFIYWLRLGDGYNSWRDIATNATEETLINVTMLALNWTIDAPYPLDLHIDSANITIDYDIAIEYFRNTTFWRYNVTDATYTVYATIHEHIPGRYEWVVVGNHSRALDSVGAAMVSAAFKNKQVEIGNGGLDMKDMWGTAVPYLMANLSHSTWRAGGPAWTNIYDSLGRLGYVDDWCTRYPVSTSNIITVAGPPANLMSEYWNEFSQAIMIYGITSGNLIDVIFAPTCWNTTKKSNYKGQYYYSDGYFKTGVAGSGIGVITTYKDINGTVGFMIYGWSGDDTYYTSKWFHETGIYYLQGENPGVTTLVVRLNYNNTSAKTDNPMPPGYVYDSHYPKVTILERLGTISEKGPHDP